MIYKSFIQSLLNNVLSKILNKMGKSSKESLNKKRQISVGDIVQLTGDYWALKSSPSNPYYKSSYGCDGVIIGIYDSGSEVSVEWNNGKINSYGIEDVTITKEIDIPPTRSIVRLNVPIIIGSTEIIKSGTRMYVQGDYAHDEHGTIFIKLDSKYLPKKIFNYPKSKDGNN